MADSLIWNNDWDSQSSQFQGNVGDSGATVGQMCSKTMKGKPSKAMGAKGKLGTVVLSKVETGGCSFMWRGCLYMVALLCSWPVVFYFSLAQESSASKTRRALSYKGGPSGEWEGLDVSRKGESRCFTYWQHSGYRFGDQMGYLPWGSLQLREEGTGAGEKQWESR